MLDEFLLLEMIRGVVETLKAAGRFPGRTGLTIARSSRRTLKAAGRDLEARGIANFEAGVPNRVSAIILTLAMELRKSGPALDLQAIDACLDHLGVEEPSLPACGHPSDSIDYWRIWGDPGDR